MKPAAKAKKQTWKAFVMCVLLLIWTYDVKEAWAVMGYRKYKLIQIYTQLHQIWISEFWMIT